MAESLPAHPPEFDDLSVESQIDYVESLWQRIAANLDGVPMPRWHADELDRRLAESETSPRDWSEVHEELVAKYNLPQ